MHSLYKSPLLSSWEMLNVSSQRDHLGGSISYMVYAERHRYILSSYNLIILSSEFFSRWVLIIKTKCHFSHRWWSWFSGIVELWSSELWLSEMLLIRAYSLYFLQWLFVGRIHNERTRLSMFSINMFTLEVIAGPLSITICAWWPFTKKHRYQLSVWFAECIVILIFKVLRYRTSRRICKPSYWEKLQNKVYMCITYNPIPA